LAGALICSTTQAQINDGVIKLGVLNDMSSLYSDIGGKGLRSTFASAAG
jgi:branched-chain amino acid transport system substrate-binding protein